MAMIAPYRTSADRRVQLPDARSSFCDDERILALMLVSLGGLRVVLACAEGEVFEAEASIALIMVLVGMMMLIRRK